MLSGFAANTLASVTCQAASPSGGSNTANNDRLFMPHATAHLSNRLFTGVTLHVPHNLWPFRLHTTTGVDNDGMAVSLWSHHPHHALTWGILDTADSAASFHFKSVFTSAAAAAEVARLRSSDRYTPPPSEPTMNEEFNFPSCVNASAVPGRRPHHQSVAQAAGAEVNTQQADSPPTSTFFAFTSPFRLTGGVSM